MLRAEQPSSSAELQQHACTPSASDVDGSLPSELRAKSAKRRAAEAMLARRFSSPALAAPETSGISGSQPKRQRTEQQQLHRPPVRVAACSDCCSHSSRASLPEAAVSAAAGAAEAWCSQDVALPPMDWPSVLQAVSDETDIVLDAKAHCYHLPGGIRVHVVTRAEQLPAALAAMRSSMQDSCVAIDLEWKPEGWAGNGPSRVALMQLASATVAVLVRVSRLGFQMPQPLRDFLSDPELTFVGFSWDSADEGKMQATFGAGRHQLFSRFLDLQQVGASLGYHGLGLGAFTKQVLGFQPPKCRKVTMSNWEARQLSAKQVQYAALDAVITGHIHRGLRLWHASPSACTSCRQMLGAVLPPPDWFCRDCQRSFANSMAMQSHRHHSKHHCTPSVCNECGRTQAVTTS